MARLHYLKVLRYLQPFHRVSRFTVEVRDYECLKIAMGWTHDPRLEHDHLREYAGPGDVNSRRIQDARVIAGACCNAEPKIILEIGTSRGHTTAVIAENAPDATVYTVNIPPEDITEGGKLTTHALHRDDIGRYYRDRGCSNVHQILANTAVWGPDFGPIDVAFIDGSHDAEFVFNDTVKILRQCRPGSLLMWHDFCPRLMMNSSSKGNVCAGIERLLKKRVIRAPIYHLRDSWVGIMQVPAQYAGVRD